MGSLILFGQKCAPEHRLHTENIEVISGNEIPPDALAGVVDCETADNDAINKQTGEDGATIAVLFVIQIRLQRPVRAVVQCAVKLDQLLRLLYRERPQQSSIH